MATLCSRQSLGFDEPCHVLVGGIVKSRSPVGWALPTILFHTNIRWAVPTLRGTWLRGTRQPLCLDEPCHVLVGGFVKEFVERASLDDAAAT
jgi:hypothetical protein